MTESTTPPSFIAQLLPRAVAGDSTALDALLRHCTDRFTILTRRMLADFRRVRRWAETDDVLQNAMVRLVKTLESVKPQSPKDFLALASLQIRRELIDLARRFNGPEGIGANHDSQPRQDGAVLHDPADASSGPASLAQWTELHAMIDELPAEERDVMGLIFYQGLAQAEAAEVLGVSLRTLQRRWHTALVKLHRVWNAE